MDNMRFQFLAGRSNWQDYDDTTNATLVAAYSRKDRSVEVTIGSYGTYIVDFTSWRQTNKADAKKQRRVRIFDQKKADAPSSRRDYSKKSSSTGSPAKSNDDPDSIIVEPSAYKTPSRIENGIIYAMVQDPENTDPAVAMMVRRVELPKTHPTHPGAFVIPYNGKYYLHADQGPAPDVRVTKIDGKPYSQYLEHKQVMEEQKAQMLALQELRLSPQQQQASPSSNRYHDYHHSPMHSRAGQGHYAQVPPQRDPYYSAAPSSPPTYQQYRANNSSIPPHAPTSSSFNFADYYNQGDFSPQGIVQHPAWSQPHQTALFDSYAQPASVASPSRTPNAGPAIPTNMRGMPMQFPSQTQDDDSKGVPSPRSYQQD